MQVGANYHRVKIVITEFMGYEKNYLVHPYYILITLVLGSITALFIGFSAAYIYSRVQGELPPVQIPNLFYANTLFLIATSLALQKTKRAYESDQTRAYKLYLNLTLVLSILFLFGQIFAWREMINLNIHLNSTTLASYLYVISGVHFTHLVAGIPFLIYFIVDAQKRLKEPASVLVYLSDPDKKRKLVVLSVYWHFLDALWIYLVLFFMVNLYI